MINIEKIQFCQEIADQIQAESRQSFAIADSRLGGNPYVPRDEQIPTDLKNRNFPECWINGPVHRES